MSRQQTTKKLTPNKQVKQNLFGQAEIRFFCFFGSKRVKMANIYLPVGTKLKTAVCVYFWRQSICKRK
jgi:hypothetical protein